MFSVWKAEKILFKFTACKIAFPTLINFISGYLRMQLNLHDSDRRWSKIITRFAVWINICVSLLAKGNLFLQCGDFALTVYDAQ